MISEEQQSQQFVDYNPRFKSLFVHNPTQIRPTKYFYYGGSGQSIEARHNEGVWLKDRLTPFLDHVNTPIWVVNGSTNIFNEINWNQTDLESFRAKGLDVFFYDLLILRDQQGHRHLPGNGKYFSEELDCLQKFIEDHQIQSKVNVFLCERGLELSDFGRAGEFKFEIHNLDIFIEEQSQQMRTFSKFPNQIEFGIQYGEPRYKAVCLNFRYEPVREMVMGFLHGKSFSQGVRKSFFHGHNSEYFKSLLGFSPEKLKHWPSIERGIEEMQAHLPYGHKAENLVAVDPMIQEIPDMQIDGEIKNTLQREDTDSPYQGVSLSIVTESRANIDYCCISEKTLFPMLYLTPFIVFSGPGSLAYLQEMGFRTYGNIWDESYDRILNHTERFDKIFDELDKLLSLPIEGLHQLVMSQWETVSYNREYLLSGKLNQWFLQRYKSLKN